MSLTGRWFRRSALTLWLTFASGCLAVTACTTSPAVAVLPPSPRETVVASPTKASGPLVQASATPKPTVVLEASTQTPDSTTPTVMVTPALPSPTPTSVPPMVTVGPVVASPTVTLFVGNTGGDGVYIRATPNLDDKLIAWPDGSAMTVLGAALDKAGRLWFNVRSSDGVIGWVPESYLVPDGPTVTPASPTPAASTRLSRDAIMAALAHGTKDDVLALLGPPKANLHSKPNVMELWFYQSVSYDSANGRVDPWLRIIVNARTGQVVEIDFYAAAS